MGVLSREKLLAGAERVRRPVKSGDEIVFRRATWGERLELSKMVAAKVNGNGGDPETDMRAALALAAVCLCNEDGSPMWPTVAQAVDDGAPALLMSNEESFVLELLEITLEVNELGKYQKAAIKEAVGNSEEIPTSSSSTDSPGISSMPESNSSPEN